MVGLEEALASKAVICSGPGELTRTGGVSSVPALAQLWYEFEVIASYSNASASICVADSLGPLDRLGKLDFISLLSGHFVGIGGRWPVWCRNEHCHTMLVCSCVAEAMMPWR